VRRAVPSRASFTGFAAAQQSSWGHLAGVGAGAAAAGPAAVLAVAGAVARACMDCADGWHALPAHDRTGHPRRGRPSRSSRAATVRIAVEQVRGSNTTFIPAPHRWPKCARARGCCAEGAVPGRAAAAWRSSAEVHRVADGLPERHDRGQHPGGCRHSRRPAPELPRSAGAAGRAAGRHGSPAFSSRQASSATTYNSRCRSKQGRSEQT